MPMMPDPIWNTAVVLFVIASAAIWGLMAYGVGRAIMAVERRRPALVIMALVIGSTTAFSVLPAAAGIVVIGFAFWNAAPIAIVLGLVLGLWHGMRERRRTIASAA